MNKKTIIHHDESGWFYQCSLGTEFQAETFDELETMIHNHRLAHGPIASCTTDEIHVLHRVYV